MLLECMLSIVHAFATARTAFCQVSWSDNLTNQKNALLASPRVWEADGKLLVGHSNGNRLA